MGQHFLADAGWRQRILRSLSVAPDEHWLEIGAGHGEMTRELLRAGARVTAIELDAPLVAVLERIAAGEPRLSVAPGDVLALNLEPHLGESSRVYGNLPYYITSPILTRLFEHAARIRTIHIVIQLEVAVRMAARPGRRDFGYLSVLTQYFSRPEIVFRIPPGAFRPRPKVTSALVRLTLPGEREGLGIANDAAFLRFAQTCFAQKRKTLANNLRAQFGVERVEAMLKEMGITSRARAEELSVAQLAQLFRAMARM
ncbi:MAG TPA: 16S rRNA (adenine(1518)-N(6)/adenine(1519)-N(6))-dimethyltransferase RsmA [Candidatus Acidoferrales bacterium]